MNNNMERLTELIKETNQLISNIKAETEAIKKETNDKYRVIYYDMMTTIKECLEISKHLDGDAPLVKLKYHAKYYCGTPHEDTCYLKLNPWDSMTLYGEKDWCISHILYNATYEKVKCTLNSDWCKNINLDEILKDWDADDFKAEFAREVKRIITLKAKKANEDYEKAQRELKEMEER